MKSFVSRALFGIMTRLLAAIIIIGMLVAESAFATIYMYMDDSGQINYTNVLSTVPVDKLKNIIEFEEYESKSLPKNLLPDVKRVSPSSNPVNLFQKSGIKKKREQQKKLETEYNTLLKKKRELDNNISFQKRRKKRKYHRRPYIQDLIRKEAQIIGQLEGLQEKLKIFEHKN